MFIFFLLRECVWKIDNPRWRSNRPLSGGWVMLPRPSGPREETTMVLQETSPSLYQASPANELSSTNCLPHHQQMCEHAYVPVHGSHHSHPLSNTNFYSHQLQHNSGPIGQEPVSYFYDNRYLQHHHHHQHHPRYQHDDSFHFNHLSLPLHHRARPGKSNNTPYFPTPNHPPFFLFLSSTSPNVAWSTRWTKAFCLPFHTWKNPFWPSPLLIIRLIIIGMVLDVLVFVASFMCIIFSSSEHSVVHFAN